MKRHCKKCPPDTQSVCRHAFGVYWCIKSDNGKGCDNPMDDVAEAWEKATWRPSESESVPVTVVQDDLFGAAKLEPAPQSLTENDY